MSTQHPMDIFYFIIKKNKLAYRYFNNVTILRCNEFSVPPMIYLLCLRLL